MAKPVDTVRFASEIESERIIIHHMELVLDEEPVYPPEDTVRFVSEIEADRYCEIPYMGFTNYGKPEYPIEWFTKDETMTTKPALTIPKWPPGTNIIHMRNTAYVGIRHNTITVHQAMAYIYSVMRSRPMTLTADWKSFGRVIGLANEKITIDNLADITPGDHMIDHLVSTTPIGQKEDRWMMLYLCAVYRLSNISRADYRTLVASKITEKLKILGAPDTIHAGNLMIYYISWRHFTPSFSTLIALCDMWWYHFKDTELAIARMGTFSSRNRDCGGLIDLAYIYRLLGLSFPKLARWIWDSSVAENFLRLFKSGNEVDDPSSYMPYFMDLKLSSESPYSTTINNVIHFWIHAVGCTLSNDRSRNARMVGIFHAHELAKLAGLFGYAVLHTTDVRNGTVKAEEEGSNEATVDTTNMTADQKLAEAKKAKLKAFRQKPTQLDSRLWYDWFCAHGRKLPPDVCKTLDSIWSHGATGRAGSVGLYLANFNIGA